MKVQEGIPGTQRTIHGLAGFISKGKLFLNGKYQ